MDGAISTCKTGVNRACGHLGAPLGFSKLFPGASSGTPGASREGKKFRLGFFEAAAVRRTDRLLFYRVGGRPGPKVCGGGRGGGGGECVGGGRGAEGCDVTSGGL